MLGYIALGGLIGTIARYLVQGWIQGARSEFPVGTLLVNVVGSFLVGFVIRYGTGAALLSPELRAGLTIGFCGAFTTMSAFGYESVALLGDGQYWRATLYMGGTLAGTLLAVLAGSAAAERLL